MERSISHTFAGTSQQSPTVSQCSRSTRINASGCRCDIPNFCGKASLFPHRRHALSRQRRQSNPRFLVHGTAHPAGAFTAPTDPLVQKQVDRAADIVGELMDDINKELFVAAAVADITREEPEVSERDAIRAVVERRIDSLDEFFVASLRLFGQAAREQSNHDVADRLGAIEEEVLQQVTNRLPAELRVLDAVQQLSSSNERVKLLKRVNSGAAADVSLPECQLSSLQTIANQVIDDMEDKELVPDRQLLARLCLIREELAVVAEEQGSNARGSEFSEAKVTYERLIPQGTAAFVKEMLGVSSKDKRQALLKKTLDEGFEDSSKKRRPHGAEPVRPGRLLTCLGAMQRELAAQGNAANRPVLDRLEELHLSVLQLLSSLAYDS